MFISVLVNTASVSILFQHRLYICMSGLIELSVRWELHRMKNAIIRQMSHVEELHRKINDPEIVFLIYIYIYIWGGRIYLLLKEKTFMLFPSTWSEMQSQPRFEFIHQSISLSLSLSLYIYIYIYRCIYSIRVILAGNGHKELRSNPGWGYTSFQANALGKHVMSSYLAMAKYLGSNFSSTETYGGEKF